jgi:hypothetical protein
MTTMITQFFAPKKRKEKADSKVPLDVGSAPDKRVKKESAQGMASADPDDDPEAELLTFLQQHASDESCWRKALATHFASPSFAKLAKFVASQR